MNKAVDSEETIKNWTNTLQEGGFKTLSQEKSLDGKGDEFFVETDQAITTKCASMVECNKCNDVYPSNSLCPCNAHSP